MSTSSHSTSSTMKKVDNMATDSSSSTSTSSVNNQHVLQSSAKGVTYTMITIAAQRLFTFTLNTALLRYVSADIIGFANADMELLLATILLTREASTLIALRVNMNTIVPSMFTDTSTVSPPVSANSANSKRRKSKDSLSSPTTTSNSNTTLTLPQQRFTNLTWLPVLLGILINCILLFIFYYQAQLSTSSSSSPTELSSLSLFCFAAFLETLAGPFVIYCQSLLLMNGRALTDITAMLVKCISIFILAAYFRLGIMAYAIGQVLYATTILGGFIITVLSQSGITISLLIPRWITVPNNLSWLETLKFQFGYQETSLLGAFAIQSIVKYLLTEGDRLLMTIIATRSSRGVYSTVTNYGSLAARLLFQPLEENMRNIVSKLVTVPDTLPSSSSLSTENLTNNRIALNIFYGLFRLVIIIGLFFSIFGPIYSPIVSNILLGKRLEFYPEFVEALSAYCIYVTFMALNGVTEAFATGAANQSRIKTSSIHMMIAFTISSICIYQFMPIYGLVGLIAANSMNMLIRTISSLSYIRLIHDSVSSLSSTNSRGTWFSFIPLSALPSLYTLSIFTITAINCWYIRLNYSYDLYSFMDSIKFIGLGMLHIIVIFGILYKYERQYIIRTWLILKGKIDPNTVIENNKKDN